MCDLYVDLASIPSNVKCVNPQVTESTQNLVELMYDYEYTYNLEEDYDYQLDLDEEYPRNTQDLVELAYTHYA